MSLSPEKIALIALAGVILFWPQVQAFFSKVFGGERVDHEPSPCCGSLESCHDQGEHPKTRKVSADPACWVAELMGIKKACESAGQCEAAALLSQAMAKIVNSSPVRSTQKPPAKGAKR